MIIIIMLCDLFDTETGMVYSYCKEQKNENSFTTGCTSYKHPHHMSKL
jgi:hypothetical protein